MRSIPTGLAQEIVKEIAFTAHLVDLSFSNPLYITDADVNIWWDGKKYHPRALRFDKAEYSMTPTADKISFEVDNVSLEFSSILMNKEVRGKSCTIRKVALTKYAQPIGATIIFAGFIDTIPVVDHKKAVFEIYNHNILWKRRTLRIHQATCPLVFKSQKCGYTGIEPWCDKSYDRCLALNNSYNFRGFRFLPSLQNKQIWWGKVPK